MVKEQLSNKENVVAVKTSIDGKKTIIENKPTGFWRKLKRKVGRG